MTTILTIMWVATIFWCTFIWLDFLSDLLYKLLVVICSGFKSFCRWLRKTEPSGVFDKNELMEKMKNEVPNIKKR